MQDSWDPGLGGEDAGVCTGSRISCSRLCEEARQMKHTLFATKWRTEWAAASRVCPHRPDQGAGRNSTPAPLNSPRFAAGAPDTGGRNSTRDSHGMVRQHVGRSSTGTPHTTSHQSRRLLERRNAGARGGGHRRLVGASRVSGRSRRRESPRSQRSTSSVDVIPRHHPDPLPTSSNFPTFQWRDPFQ